MNTTFASITDLSGQVVIIAGGLGQVGFATAERLAKKNATVVILSRGNLNSANEKLKSLTNFDRLGHCHFEASVTDTSSLKNAFDKIKQKFNRCDILVNAAAISKSIKPIDLENLTDEIFDEIVTTNLRGSFATIRTFAPLLKMSGNGLIINISSTASLRASQSNLAYAASKAGINLITQSLAVALAPEVRVLSISPGYLLHPTSGINKSTDFNPKQATQTPLQRIGHADDIAATIEACALSLRFATGTNLVIDGGRTL